MTSPDAPDTPETPPLTLQPAAAVPVEAERTAAAPLPPAAAVVEVAASELVGPGVVFCPHPRMTLWSGHPRVFIDVATTGHGRCPYCGTLYRLEAGAKVGTGH